MPTYAGRVKCVYIDPPYNTGNEGWCYSDRLNSKTLAHWFDEVSPVDVEDLERHDKWLCMMWPRLHLLRELLAEDGVIFVSIDDNEQHHLRAIMDEIFGETNFVTNIIWQKKYSPQNDSRSFSDNHDFVVCYAKSKSDFRIIPLPRTEKQNQRYANPDNDPRGRWKSSGLNVKTYLAEYDYPITTPSGRVVNPPTGSCWMCSRDRFEELVADNRIWFGKSGNNVPSVKRFLTEVKDGLTPLTIWTYEEVGHSQSGTQGLNRLGVQFPNPKPHTLIDRMLRVAAGPDDIVLDSFAGSGTTAHAVLALNKEDGGNRRFILVECEEYADTITAERVRRVMDGVPSAKDADLREGYGGGFTYCTLGEPITVEGMLTGESMPAFDQLAAYLVNCATGSPVRASDIRTPDDSGFDTETSFVYETDRQRFHLFYRPSTDWLASNEGALNSERAAVISAESKRAGKSAVVFAPVRYMNSADLRALGITFCQLPYELTAARAQLG